MKSTFWNSIILFYLIAVGITWTLSTLIIFEVLPVWTHYLNAYGPMIAALIMFRKDPSRLKHMMSIKNNTWFWIGWTSPLWVSLLVIVSLLIMQQPTPDVTTIGDISFLGNIGLWAFPLWIVTFGLGEELGWRGFLFTELTKRYSLIVSTLIVWVLWSLWHLPFFFYLPTYTNMDAGAIFGFLMSLFSGTFFLSWLFQKSERSLPTVILWHAAFNLITASAFGSGLLAMALSMVIIVLSIYIFIEWIVRKQNKE